MARLQVIKGGAGEVGMGLADYIWVSTEGMAQFKKKPILVGKDNRGEAVPIIRRWSFQGCACPTACAAPCQTPQDVLLSPCFYLPDPTRPAPSYLILCETRDTNDTCLADNYRRHLRLALNRRGPTAKLLWFGFEQQFVLDEAGGESPNLAERRFLTTERHLGACFDAGIMIHSLWNPLWADYSEFKVGVRGFPQDLDPDPPTALVVTDHLVVAHYLLEKVANEKGLTPCWKGLTLFVSTPQMREPGGNSTLEAARLMELLVGEGRSLRAVPDPVNGGTQCLELGLEEFTNPYKLALDVLEAIWPLDNQAAGQPTAEELDDEEDDQP